MISTIDIPSGNPPKRYLGGRRPFRFAHILPSAGDRRASRGLDFFSTRWVLQTCIHDPQILLLRIITFPRKLSNKHKRPFSSLARRIKGPACYSEKEDVCEQLESQREKSKRRETLPEYDIHFFSVTGKSTSIFLCHLRSPEQICNTMPTTFPRPQEEIHETVENVERQQNCPVLALIFCPQAKLNRLINPIYLAPSTASSIYQSIAAN